jgi:sRNA-binding protein
MSPRPGQLAARRTVRAATLAAFLICLIPPLAFDVQGEPATLGQTQKGGAEKSAKGKAKAKAEKTKTNSEKAKAKAEKAKAKADHNKATGAKSKKSTSAGKATAAKADDSEKKHSCPPGQILDKRSRAGCL